jgi:hypothetical protein
VNSSLTLRPKARGCAKRGLAPTDKAGLRGNRSQVSFVAKLMPRRQRRRSRWPKVLMVFAGVTAVFLIIGQIVANNRPPPVPGWDGLYLCSYVASLDGAKILILE